MNDTGKANNTPQEPPNKSAPGKRSRWQWLYFLLLLVLIVPAILNFNFTTKVITGQQFQKEILSQKAVEKIVVVNNEKAEIYIKK